MISGERKIGHDKCSHCKEQLREDGTVRRPALGPFEVWNLDWLICTMLNADFELRGAVS